jgi:hypothetical protein
MQDVQPNDWQRYRERWEESEYSYRIFQNLHTIPLRPIDNTAPAIVYDGPVFDLEEVR